MKYRILFSILVCTTGVGSVAQTIAQDSSSWDITLNSDYSEKVNDAFLLQDGRLVVVGETSSPGQGKQGLLIIFDAVGGNILLHKDYGLANDNVLLSGAYAGDGTLYLVGYTQTNQLGEQGWLLRVDADTGEEILSDERQGNAGDDRFEKIVWMDTGKGLIAGRSTTAGDGMIWLLKVDGNEIIQQPSVGNGEIGSLVGLEKGSGFVWICGYTKKRGPTDKGDVWLIKFTDSGGILYKREVPKHPGQKVFGLTCTVDGDLLMAGRVWNSNGDSDVWLGEISRQGRDSVQEKIFGTDYEDSSNALFKTPGGNKWLVVYRESSRSTVVQVCNNDFEPTLKSKPFHNFKAVRLIWLAKNTYLIIGNDLSGRRENYAVRAMCLNDREEWNDRGGLRTW